MKFYLFMRLESLPIQMCFIHKCISVFVITLSICGLILLFIYFFINIRSPAYNCHVNNWSFNSKSCSEQPSITLNFTLLFCDENEQNSCTITGSFCITDDTIMRDLIEFKNNTNFCCDYYKDYYPRVWLIKRTCKYVELEIIMIVGAVLSVPLIVWILITIWKLFNKHVIKTKQINAYIHISNIPKNDKCFICLEDVIDNNVTKCCNQCIHYDCALDLLANGNDLCPICRNIIGMINVNNSIENSKI